MKFSRGFRTGYSVYTEDGTHVGWVHRVGPFWAAMAPDQEYITIGDSTLPRLFSKRTEAGKALSETHEEQKDRS